MSQRDTRDVIGGLGLSALGLFAAWYAHGQYELGDLQRMGPGYFPLALGLILAVLGLLVAIPAWFRRGEPITVAWKTLGLVTLSIIVFAFLLKTVGIVVATMVSVLVSSLADSHISWRARLGVAIGVAAVTWLVFILGLSMVIPVWPWSP